MRVEEIFRGERYLADEEEEGDSSASANEAVPPASSATVAIVEGLANRKICASRPRIGERRIFFANPMDAVTLVKKYHFVFFRETGLTVVLDEKASSAPPSPSSRTVMTTMRHVILRSSLLRPTKRNLDALRRWRKEGDWGNEAETGFGGEIDGERKNI